MVIQDEEYSGNQNSNNMSAEERLNQARQLRQQQVQKWHEDEMKQVNGNAENEEQENLTNNNKSKSKKQVKFGNTITLLEAAARDDLDEVGQLLCSNVDPNEANEDGLTALHQACIDNFDEMVTLLIEHNANVNAVDREQWTPLHAACTCGHTNIAQILIKKGANLLALNADHNMPYDICEEDETLAAVEKAMAAQGITQEQINTMRSAQEHEIIKELREAIKSGKRIDFVDEDGATVLHVAAANGYTELAKFLINNNVDVNSADNDGWTPLHAAACWCQTEVVELLGEENADPSLKNNMGEIAADVTDDEDIKTLLIKIKTERRTKQRKFPRFPKLPSRYGSKRSSGIRGRSFKDRSLRENKFATLEAKSEAQYWAGHQDESNDSVPINSSKDNHNIVNNKRNGHTDNSIKPEITIVDSVKIKANNRNKDKKKDKKSKKSKAPSPPTSDSITENIPSNQNNLKKVTNSKQQYSFSESNENSLKIDEKSCNSDAGTLLDLKKRRASETKAQNKEEYVVSHQYNVETIHQYRGSTSNDMISAHPKRKVSCVII